MSIEPVVIETPEQQQKRINAYHAKAVACDNLGQSGDDKDLYWVTDALIAEIKAVNPPFACRSGCNQCCYTPPQVSSLEWQALYPHLLALPTDTRTQILEMAELQRAVQAPLALKLADLMAGRPLQQLMQNVSVQCAFLVGGECAVYAGRPFACRAFGFMLLKGDGEPKLYGSMLARMHISQNFKHKLNLPLIDPYGNRLHNLNKVKVSALLPQWLWAHIDNGEFAPEAQPHPDFFTGLSMLTEITAKISGLRPEKS